MQTIAPINQSAEDPSKLAVVSSSNALPEGAINTAQFEQYDFEIPELTFQMQFSLGVTL